jgi:chemotaxis protein methyltransferase CheR
MAPEDLAVIAGAVQRRAGICIGTDKSYLVESRLLPLARKLGLSGLQALAARLRSSPPASLVDAVTEAMTVNETSFFRDERVFRTLGERIAPELSGVGTPRIWSAAASTGQEAWSIAVTLLECGISRFEIVGTDVSSEAVARAAAGLYSQFEVQRGLTIHRLIRHFQQEGQAWRVAAAVRARARFQCHNLLEDAAALGRFHMVFLRNVMI